MTTTQLTFTKQSPFPKQRIITLVGGSVLLLLIVATTILLLSPIGVRWRADQTAAVPVVGTTEIDVLADARLNHIFAPAVTQIEVGETVTWHFNDIDEDGQAVVHNVVFDDLASPSQAVGTFSRTFDQPGTYQYVCTLHAFMEGAVVVTAAQ